MRGFVENGDISPCTEATSPHMCLGHQAKQKREGKVVCYVGYVNPIVENLKSRSGWGKLAGMNTVK
jgi:hypothetical protein